MTKLNKLCLFLLLLPIIIFAGNSDRFGKIEGKVFDKNTMNPLPSANVIIEGISFGCATDIDGKYSIPDVPTGAYKVIVSMMGYRVMEKTAVVLPDQTAKLDFPLIESPLETEPLVVTATRTPRYIKDVPVRTEVITNKMVEEKNAANLYEALDGLPGVRVEQQCSYCNFSMVRLEGLGPDHTQVLIDGQPTYSGLASVYGLQQLGTADIDRIEIVKGAGSALYGSGAVAGAINIISKEPSRIPETNVSMEFGNYNTYNFSLFASKKINKTGIILTAQKHGGNAIDQSGDVERKPDGYSDRVKSNNMNAGFKITADTLFGNDRLTIDGKVVYEYRQGGLMTDDTYDNPFTESTERIITNRYESKLGYNKIFEYDNELNFTLATTFHRRNATNDTYLGDYMATHHDSVPSIDEMRPYIADENLYALNLNYLQPFLKKHRFLFGLQYSHNRLEETGKYVVVDEDDPDYGTPYTSTSDKHADEFGAYIQDEFSLIEPILEIVAGARYDFHNSEDNFRGSGDVAPEGVPPVKYKESAFNPRFAIKYRLFQNLTLRSNIGTGFRVPYGFSEDLHLCSGSPRVWKGTDLKPEKSLSINFSMDYGTDKLNLSASVFHTELDGKIGFIDASEAARRLGYTYEWKNIDDAYVQGIEMGGSFLLVDNLRLDANFTINDGKYKHEREDWIETPYHSESKYISRIPRYTTGLKFSFTPMNWEFMLNGNYQGPVYIDYHRDDEEPTEIKKTEPYLIVDAKVSKHLFGKFTIFIGSKNMTDYIQPERHTDDAAFIYAPLFGRTIYGGIKIKI